MLSKYQYLLKDDNVRRWFENLNTRSVITATIRLRTLGLFCEIKHSTPKEILKVAATKQFKDEFTDFVRLLEKQGKVGSHIIRFKKVLQSWLAYNDFDIRINVNIAGEYDSPTLTNERVPSKEELDKILRMASPRGRRGRSLRMRMLPRQES